MAYAKLDENILTSSLWSEDDKTLRVWIYLLARVSFDGRVSDTVPAIARACGYTVADIEAILAKLSSPDRHSRTPGHEGRRVLVEYEPEFAIVLVNYAKYRAKDHTAAERKRRQRDMSRRVTASHGESRRVTQAEAEAEANTETDLSAFADVNSDNDIGHDHVTQASITSKPVDQVYAHWSKATSTVPRAKGVIKAIKDRIAKRLAEGFTAEQLIACVSWAMVDEFYLSNGYAKQPDVIWRNAVRVEKLAESWASRSRAAPKSQAPQQPATTLADIAQQQASRGAA